MVKRVLLTLCFLLALSTCADAQFVRLYGGDNGSTTRRPVSPSNPLPVDASVTVTSLDTLTTVTNPVGVKGADGAAIVSASNPFIAQMYALDQTGTLNPVDGSNPTQFLGVRITDATGNAYAAATPLPALLDGINGNAAMGYGNPIPVTLSDGSAIINASNPQAVQLSQSNTVVSDTNPLSTASAGNAIADMTNIGGTVDDTADTVTLTAASRHIRVANNDAANTLWIAIKGTAVAGTGSYGLPPGREFEYNGSATVSEFTVIADTGMTADYSVFAY